jgi:hypothetical protein
MLVVPEQAGRIDAPLERHAPPQPGRPEIRKIPIHFPILWCFRLKAEAANPARTRPV